MATVNTKFIANPSFMIQSVGKQTITVSFRPKYVIDTAEDKTANPPVSEAGHYAGFADWPILDGLFEILRDGGNSRFSPLSVSLQPSIDLVGTKKKDEGDPAGEYKLAMDGIFFFGTFLGSNPIHCTKINVRASIPAALPSTMEILTPNIFTGQFDRQIVNVLADSNMYQNQSNIITLDCDFFIARNSLIRVDSQFTEATAPTLAMDMTFDKYLSLEKAMVENYQLLQTNAGMENAIVEEVNTINAKTEDFTTATMVKAPVTQFKPVSPWRRTIGSGGATGSVQPTVGKEGTNYL